MSTKTTSLAPATATVRETVTASPNAASGEQLVWELYGIVGVAMLMVVY